MSFANSLQSSMLSESPSEPKPPTARRILTRRTIFGGFILTDEEAFKWANRLLAEKGKQQIKLSRWDEGICLMTLEERVIKAGGIQVDFHGKRRPENGGACDQYIVVTQTGVGIFEYDKNGEPVMDPLQKLVPGPFEERAKELLKQEGVQHAEFDSIIA